VPIRHSPLHHRARSALLWAGAWFMFAQFLGGLVLDYVWTSVRFPSADRHMAALEQMPASPDIIFFGSSRFEAGIHLAEIQRTLQAELPGTCQPRVFNAAVPAGDPICGDYLLKQMLSRGVRPALAIIEVSPETLSTYNEWLAYHIRRQLCWNDVPAYFLDICRSRLIGKLVMARVLPLHVHRRQLRQDLVERLNHRLIEPPPLEHWQAAGSTATASDANPTWAGVLHHFGDVPSAEQRENTQRWIGQPYRWLGHFQIGGTATAALERMLERCREHGIRPILVGVPVTQPHRAAYTPPIEAAFQMYVHAIVQRFGCSFVDYRAQVPDAFFSDNHHLLPDEGGLYFSHRLACEVLAPAWRLAAR
jgi:hypothetical protein